MPVTVEISWTPDPQVIGPPTLHAEFFVTVGTRDLTGVASIIDGALVITKLCIEANPLNPDNAPHAWRTTITPRDCVTASHLRMRLASP